MKPHIYSKVIYIVLYGFFSSPFLLIGLLAGAVCTALKTGWLWAEALGDLE